MSNKLTECNPKDIEKFTITGEYQTLVCSVYDGDTCTCIIDFNNKLQKFSVRLTGIDTPEMKSKDPKLKKQAIEARDYVRSLVLDKVVRLEASGLDKYGRILGKLFVDDKCVNDMIIEKKFANEYYGGTKQEFENE